MNPPIKQQASMGILQMEEAEKKFQLTRYAPSSLLAPFVKHFWLVSWNLSEQSPFYQDVIPNPCVNLIIEQERSGIYGVASRKYTKELIGTGKVFGVKFKPGGFYPFMMKPLSSLTDQAIALKTIFPHDNNELFHALRSSERPEHLISLAQQLLAQQLPKVDENVHFINQIIDYITTHTTITKVEQLCDQFQLSSRKLQRLFSQYVGVSPKWVIQLYRLQNAAEALDRGLANDFAKLSLELGYYDQSHFINDFKSIIGKTPEEYVRASAHSYNVNR
ncbi:AraC family transcriptional regulator [Paenibacillus sp. GSMTC-2017]|uniref:AraC family transcriptional regulator n=1 Tax=Paenibacillus sp. GSMTC-2017 TaxID=2794350 RepID=UPI0018D74207|nr:helix-turn-helix domain-containing protein [Paenibacillus sp. GSMTC-2017]MBH5318627.1 AraC family transcriptional regulator [Paenibacillus sp. GSMTC-2017]